MAPRLFTIASHSCTQRNVIVAASLVPKGLISNFFLQKPQNLRAELRKSTFSAFDRWKKVIMVGAGTGLAPFRGYIQEKQYNMALKKEGKEAPTPLITLIFGCKHQNGDFIYKDEILGWKESGAIDRLHLAFSRDTDKVTFS
jgi:sulfite reductase alpha subunit-like flavoprotein